MHFLSLSLALGALSSLVSIGANGSPVDPKLVERQTSGQYFVVAPLSGGVQQRLEIRDLQANTDMWNLFVLALTRLMSQPQTAKLSYYQVAGIHGIPYVDWDGAKQYDPNNAPWWGGYCPHSSNLFGSWHRPYILVLEQLMNTHANAIVAEIPNSNPKKAAFQALANQMRWPYWDWAKKVNGVITPTALSQANIAVTFPQNGTTRTLANPLYAYKFQTVPNPDFGSGWQNYRQTYRGVNLESVMQNAYTSRRNNVLTLFSRFQTYNQFSTDANGNNAPNVEAIHNSVHVDIGGFMPQVPYSAFDPIFFLHHCNIDRLIAIWQTIYPNSWIAAASQSVGTRAIAPGTTADASTGLSPFHIDQTGKFWNSNQVRYTTSLGYTYPEIANNKNNASLVAAVNNLYGTSRPSFRIMTAGATTSYDYLVQISAAKGALGGNSWEIDFFLGDVPSNAATFAADPAYVGRYGFLPMPGMPTTVISSGTMMLTDALKEAGVSVSDRNATVAYLQQNFHWRIVQKGQVVTDPVQNLNITVVSNMVQTTTSSSDFSKPAGNMETIDGISGQ